MAINVKLSSGAVIKVNTQAEADQLQALDAAANSARSTSGGSKNAGFVNAVNIEHRLEGSKLTLVMDLAKTHGKSSTGKTEIIATTRGNTALDVPGVGTVKLGINVYR